MSSRENNINVETLKHALSKLFRNEIVSADWHITQMPGGFIGDVRAVTGTAKTADGENLPYKIVHKIDREAKERPLDRRWRREYDLSRSEFYSIFSNPFRIPECYHSELKDAEAHLWMEYIKGVSGKDLTIEMLEKAATEIGRFQGRLWANKPPVLLDDTLFNEHGTEAMKNDYLEWIPYSPEYMYIRSSDCLVPEHLRQMLIDLDDDAENVFAEIAKLPVVLCHKDCWIENIFYSDGIVILIDWDFCGFGFLGEGIACLIADDIADMSCLDEYYRRLIPAYYLGASEYIDLSRITCNYIREMMLLKFGYRFIHRFLKTDSSDGKKQQITALQKIYETGR